MELHGILSGRDLQDMGSLFGEVKIVEDATLLLKNCELIRVEAVENDFKIVQLGRMLEHIIFWEVENMIWGVPKIAGTEAVTEEASNNILWSTHM